MGEWLSSTVMICTQVLLLLQSSVDVHVRVIVFSWGHDPETITSLNTTVGETSQLSVEVADPVFAGIVLAVHSIVILGGHIKLGTVLSSTKMIWLQELIFP